MKENTNKTIRQPNETSVRVGKILRELRHIKNWTQEKVAKKLGMPTNTYAAYENGDNRQNAEVIIKLAELYGVTTDRILGFKDIQYAPFTITISDENGIRKSYKFNQAVFKPVCELIEIIKELYPD